MSLRPFMSYYGGKWRLAPHYPPPKYDVIVEPFAGAAGYATRYPDRDVLLCDLNPKVCGVWDYLIHASEKEILAIPDVPPDGTVDDLHVPQEARWLVGFWLQGPSQNAPHKRPSKWARSVFAASGASGFSGFWGPRVRERLASQVHAIRHWQILNVSYAEITPSTPATWFVDPPYQVKGMNYTHGSRSIDFQHLGAWCRSLPGQVMVCENDGATWLPFTHFRDIVGAQARRSTEVLWYREEDPS